MSIPISQCTSSSPFPFIYAHLNAEFQRLARRDKKAFLREEIEEKQQNGND